MAIIPHPIAPNAIDHPDAANGHDVVAKREIEDHIHPSLRESFVQLPPVGTPLTNEQLAAVFGGDLRALLEFLCRLRLQAI